MVIHPTPKQDEIVENLKWQTIRSVYSNYEATFVILHPFLKIKAGCEKMFEVENYPYDWPTKEEINNCSEGINWQEVIKQIELKDIKELDRLLGYLHCARRTADRSAWIKFMRFIDKENCLPAQVDSLPEILVNPLFISLKLLGYNTVLEYTELLELRAKHSVENIIDSNKYKFYSHSRITTDDNSIYIATDFDQRFSYISSSNEILKTIIQEADLEGFYCNDLTKQDWSYIEQIENIIDWKSPDRNNY